jgi:hypothetical protein
MYGDKEHFVIEKNKINIEKTIHRYYTNFNNKMQQLCPKNKIDLSKIPIGFGEFALDLNDIRQKYDDVLNHSNKIKFIQYWNHSKWDHLGVLADYQVNSQLLYKPSKPTKVRKPSNKEK